MTIPRPIKKLLVANRSEIAIRVFRSAHELGIRTVAIYSFEDRYALHRFKADEAYQIGEHGSPIRAYSNIEEVIRLAEQHGVDAIHPGYGFLSEKPEFARACAAAGITFIGPSVESLEALGNKTSAREIARLAQVPILGGSSQAIKSLAELRAKAVELGYPIILKAAHGGGGRGMRVVRSADELTSAFEQAQRESLTAFGSDEIFVENYIQKASHIEVQLMGDQFGTLLHLFDRDCSVQRRHQKVVECAPAPNLSQQLRDELCEAALAIGRAVKYYNAGTVEFLVDREANKFYFIEVNPRIQVEHTVTEEVTGIDIVRTQILVAAGIALHDEQIDLPNQAAVKVNGFAVQCRITTEDPENGFMPDYGRLSHYRSASGMGIRLDAGSAFSGAVVHPFYDSLLVKVTARGRTFREAVRRMERSLHEFRVRGVKTNIPFLIQLMDHPTFLNGQCTTRFIDDTPALFDLPRRKNRATRLLTYLAEVIVNGNDLVRGRPIATRRLPARRPDLPPHAVQAPEGSRQLLQRLGPQGLSQWILEQKRLLVTDTTFRDAHQSLLATRMRTFDMVAIADAYAHLTPDLFSLEVWGGATFDTAMRFLAESPWQRLAELREKIPNILLQMLLRASNAVGYTNYPDNVVQAFVEEAANAGVDLFRVFDALNWLPNMTVAMDAVLKTGAICEASICYTGDISDPSRTKYDLRYYVELAKQLEQMGAHILAIKDMAGLCKPSAAATLIRALKDEIGIPVHFHTHDTSGIQAAAILAASEAGVDIVDLAMAPLSGGTSQPNLNTLVEALRFSDRDAELPTAALDEIAAYWRSAREFYTPFESYVLPATADLYQHEMPGGQYTNLFQQARALGLADRWNHVCRVYAAVNELFGDIVKVTPTSKAVGDMALFMVANDLTAADVLSGERELAYPASVRDLIGGRMGQPPGGFPPIVMERILRGEPALTDRPGETLEPADFDQAARELTSKLKRPPNRKEVVSYLLYPKVFADYAAHDLKYSDVSGLPTPAFFYGLDAGEEVAVEIEPGKTLIFKFLTMGEGHPDGTRVVFFELNGQPREVSVTDRSLAPDAAAAVKADPTDPKQIGAAMPGMVVTVSVQVGDVVTPGQPLLSLEAMKMETTITAENSGKVAVVLIKPGSQIDTGDLLLSFE